MIIILILYLRWLLTPLVGIGDFLSGVFNRIKCKQIVKYYGKTISIEGVGVDVAPVSVNLEGLKTNYVKLDDASEITKQIDSFQFHMCDTAKALGKKHPEFIKFWKLRASGIVLLSNFAISLAGFEKNPEFFKASMKDALDDMREFVRLVVFESFIGIDRSPKKIKTFADSISDSTHAKKAPTGRAPSFAPDKAIFWMRPMDYTVGQPVPLQKDGVFVKGWAESEYLLPAVKKKKSKSKTPVPKSKKLKTVTINDIASKSPKSITMNDKTVKKAQKIAKLSDEEFMKFFKKSIK